MADLIRGAISGRRARRLLGRALRHSWRRRSTLAQLYQALAAQMPDARSAAAMRRLAAREEQELARCTRRLKQLQLGAPPQRVVGAGLCRWLLPVVGLHRVLAWAAWAEQREAAALAALLQEAYQQAEVVSEASSGAMRRDWRNDHCG